MHVITALAETRLLASALPRGPHDDPSPLFCFGSVHPVSRTTWPSVKGFRMSHVEATGQSEPCFDRNNADMPSSQVAAGPGAVVRVILIHPLSRASGSSDCISDGAASACYLRRVSYEPDK